MTSFKRAILASALFTGCCSVAPAHAQVLGGNGGLVGTITDTLGAVGETAGEITAPLDSVVNLDSGPASRDAAVNIGLGDSGGGGNILDVQTGGGLGGVAGVEVGSSGGGIQANVDVLGADIDVDLFGGGGRGGPGGPSGPGGNPGGPGNNPGTPGGPGGPGGSGGPGGPGIIVFGGGGSGGAGAGARFAATCSVEQGRQLLQMASKVRVNPQAWRRAANVEIVPVKLCASTRAQVARILQTSSKINQLQGAASSDPLISASLDRTRYNSDDVFAVAASNGRLTVYVY